MNQTPPLPSSVAEVSYPEIPSRKLPNGMTVLVVENRRIPRLGVRLLVRAGRIHNPDDNLSLIPLAAELLKQGTAWRDAEQIAGQLDQAAIQFDLDIHMEHCLLDMDLLASQIETGMELLSEMVRFPTFPEEELQKLKVRWHSELIGQRSIPEFLAKERLYHTLYPDHPYRKWTMTPEQLEAASREQIEEVFRSRFVPSEAILLLAGAISPQQGFRLAESHWGSWHGERPDQPDFASLAAHESRRVELVHRPHSEQARLVVVGRTFPRGHPDAHRLRVANQVLGGGASSRLFLNLREARGYTYGIYSFQRSFRHDGLLLAGTNVRSDVVGESVREIFSEFRRLQQEPPGSQEMAMARSELTGNFLFSLETPASVGMLEITRRLYGLPENYFPTYLREVQAVSAGQVQQMAQRYLNPDHFVVIAVGDRNKLEDSLQEFGSVQVYDTEGKRL
ncbi:MAG: pitrilysin family protein [Acidobacteriota bacterium]